MGSLKLIAAIALISGAYPAWAQAPVITAINNYLGDRRLAPGGVAQVYGTWPVDGARNFTVTVGSLTGSVNVSWINRGVPVELDIQIPTDAPLGPATIVISHLGASSNAFPVTISPFDPLLVFDPFSAFLHLSGTSVTPTSPSVPGEVVTTFMSGLGVTNPSTPLGALISSFIPTATSPTVTLGGKPVQLQFAGLYPGGKTGSYQVSFTVPADTATGPQTVVVSIGGVSSNPQTLFVGSQPLASPPVVAQVVNGASFSAKSDISPGSFMTIFASGLGDTDNLAAFPATTVNGISVLVNWKLAPIFHLIASKNQINALVPSDADMSASLSIVVQNQNGGSKQYTVSGAAAGPGIFLVGDPTNSSRKNAAATIANSSWLLIPVSQAKTLGIPGCAGLSPANLCGQPAHPGDFVQLYTTGLGKATPNGDPNGAVLPSGQVAPVDGSPVYLTVNTPTVTVGGLAAKVLFSGLTPGDSGLYQVNFQIPAGVAVSDNVPVQISMPNSVPDSATIAVSN